MNIPSRLDRRSFFRSALALSACALILPAGCKSKEETPTPEVSVQAAQPHRGDIAEEIAADATLTPLAQAAIAPKVTAPVKKFLVQRGTRVQARQLLATLENNDLSAAELDNKGTLAAAQAGYETATRATVPEDFTRAQLDLGQAKAQLDLNQSIVTSRTQLFAQGAIPGRDLDTAKAALVQAQATYYIAKQHFESVQKTSNQAALDAAKGQLESAKGKYLQAQAQLGYTEIRSPIAGVVTDRPLFAGETAPAGAPLITVMDTSALIAKLHIAQVLAQHLTVGATASISVPGIDEPVDGKVSLISPALDPGSTTVEVWLRIENPKGATPVHAIITGRSAKDALLIPAEALQTAPNGSKYVMTIGPDSAAHKHPVTIGLLTAKQAQVLTGISSSDMIIATGSFSLDEGTKVKIAAPDADAKDDAKEGDSKAGEKPAAGKAGDDK
jgi:multidrug efflux pump subunit AcrA (membrane-fusion protein)